MSPTIRCWVPTNKVKDLKTLVRKQRQLFNFNQTKKRLPDAQVIRMPFNADFREKLNSGALDEHINNAIQNSGLEGPLNAELGRTQHFNEGKEEASVTNLSDYRNSKRKLRNP